MLKQVTVILAAMWLGLIVAPESVADLIGLTGVGALVLLLIIDRLTLWRTGRRNAQRKS